MLCLILKLTFKCCVIDSPYNLKPFGLENGTGYEGHADVFHPVADPSGLITATVTRK